MLLRPALTLSLAAALLVACGQDPASPTPTGSPAGGAPAGAGADTFRTYCSQCHGMAGEGSRMGLGPELVGKASHWDAPKLLEYLADPAAYAKKDPRLGQRPMPAIAASVDATTRAALVEHVLALMGG